MSRTFRFAIRVGGIVLLLGLVVVSQVALAQRVLLFEDFESATPDPPDPDGCATGMDSAGEPVNLADACIGAESVDSFNRSRVQDETDSLDTVTGATFPDPFDPGNNQSLVLHNPHGSTQMAVNWFSIFPDDADDPNYYLRNGVIEFDVYLEAAQPESLFTYFGIRFGFEPDPLLRNQVSTVGDQTIWNVFNLYGDMSDPVKAQTASDILLFRASPGFQDNLYDQGNSEFFLDPNAEVVVEDRRMHVRYELNGDNSTYTVSIDNLDDPDDPVEIVWPGGNAEQPWAKFFNFITFQNEPAPGINEITFITDASGFAVSGVSQNTYIDNLRIIDNDLAPLNADFDSDGDVDGHDFLIWQMGAGITSSATLADGDADGDGAVDDNDLAAWEQQFGTTTVLGAATAATVPEPASVALLVLGCAAFALQTRS